MLLGEFVPGLGPAYHWSRVDGPTGRTDFPTPVLGFFFFLNLLLGTFNLLPVPPLDGSTGILLFMGEDRGRRYLDWLRGNSYTMLGLVLAVFAVSRLFWSIEVSRTAIFLPRAIFFPLFSTLF